MKNKTRKILLVSAIAAMLLLTSACGGSSESSQPEGSQQEEQGNAVTDGTQQPPAEGGVSYTDEYDPDAMFKFGMTPAKDSDTGRYGFKNEAGEWVIEPQFYMAREFQMNGTAFARIGTNSDLYNLINRDGELVCDYLFMRCTTSDPYFSLNGIAAGKIFDADGEEVGIGYFYLENDEIQLELVDADSISNFSDDGYAVVDGSRVIDSDFETVLEAPENIYIMSVQNGMISYRNDDTDMYGYMDLEGNFVGETSSYSVSPFADNGFAIVGNQIVDRNFNVVASLEGTGYSTITNNFLTTDWVEVSAHLTNRGGTDFNFMNEAGELFFPVSAYEHSHSDGTLAIKNGIYVGPAPVMKDAQGNITGIGDSGEYAEVAVNEDMEILYVPSEKGIRNVEAYCSDGYAYAENEDEQRVIVDMEGNIVMVQR